LKINFINERENNERKEKKRNTIIIKEIIL